MAAGAVTLALLAATSVLGRGAHMASSNGSVLPLWLACLAVGVLLAARRPGNAMGWCLLGAALSLGLTAIGGTVSVLDYRLHHAVPMGAVAVLLQPFWAPAIVLFSLCLLVFPDGHFSSRVVRWVTWLVLAASAVWMAGAFGIAAQALVTHSVRVDASGNLLTVDNPRGSWAWWGVVQYAFFLALGCSLIVWVVQQVPRYRGAGDEERHQMKWLMSGAVAAIAFGIVAALFGTGQTIGWLGGAGVAGLSVLPLSIAVGVTKFHLYDIDRVISRTLSYVLLTGLVVGVYAGVVTLATKVIGFSSPVAVAASTLVAAAMFNPLRKRLQRGVDRRFNRARYDAEQIVSAFAEGLRESVDPDVFVEQLMEVLHVAFEPSAAGLWIRREPR
ncbi:MAG TPA: hypothetical protein VMD59_06020 [Acidimicrobiales bacterium]|nr:hypothetical protein [Acidimicrobiales bacterium]